jgi:hypothetical protein
VEVGAVALERRYDAVEQYVQDTVDMSPMFSGRFRELDEGQQADVVARIRTAAKRFVQPDGSVVLPGSSLVAAASA